MGIETIKACETRSDMRHIAPGCEAFDPGTPLAMRPFDARAFVIALPILLGISCPATAETPKVVSPDMIEGSTKVDAEELIELVDKVPNVTIIDSRIATDRAQGHIEGSISLPDEVTTCDTLADVVASKDDPVLFYCNGPKCGRSVVAVRKALECGYSQIFWFRGGFEEWKQKKYPYIKE